MVSVTSRRQAQGRHGQSLLICPFHIVCLHSARAVVDADPCPNEGHIRRFPFIPWQVTGSRPRAEAPELRCASDGPDDNGRRLQEGVCEVEVARADSWASCGAASGRSPTTDTNAIEAGFDNNVLGQKPSDIGSARS